MTVGVPSHIPFAARVITVFLLPAVLRCPIVNAVVCGEESFAVGEGGAMPAGKLSGAGLRLVIERWASTCQIAAQRLPTRRDAGASRARRHVGTDGLPVALAPLFHQASPVMLTVVLGNQISHDRTCDEQLIPSCSRNPMTPFLAV